MLQFFIWLLFGSLHLAAQYDDLERMRMYLDKGADVNARDKQGVTPLFYTANKGSVEGARLLLRHGADIRALTSGGGTVLHSALLKKHSDLSIFFIERGADIHQATVAGVTPLHMAVQNGLGRVAAELINRGAGVNVLTARGQSPLLVAFLVMGLKQIEMDENLIRLLFAAGAEPRLDDPPKLNILSYARLQPRLWELARSLVLEFASKADEEERKKIHHILERMEKAGLDSAAVDEDEDNLAEEKPGYGDLMARAEELGRGPVAMPIDIFSLARAFADAHDPELTAELMDKELSVHESAFVRRVAFTAIRYMGCRAYDSIDVAAMIKRGLEDSDAWVRYDAVWAGETLGLDDPEFRAGLLKISGGADPEYFGEIKSSDALANSARRAARLLASLTKPKEKTE